MPQILTDLIASGVKVDGDLDGEREVSRFNTVIATLQANQPALRSLIQTRVLKRIWFSNSNPDSFFDVTDGTLFIATQKPGLRILGPVLQCLAQQYDISARLGIPVGVAGAGALDLNYLTAVSLLRASFFEIAGKTDQIRKITLGSSRSSFSRGSSGHLQIGYLDSFDELEQVLSWIH